MQGYKKISIFDLIIMALTVFGEASICDDYEQIRVGWTILNRAETWKWSIAKVCLTPWHFSCWKMNKYLWRFIVDNFNGYMQYDKYEWREFLRALSNCMYACNSEINRKAWAGMYYHDKSIPKPETWDELELIEETKHFKFYKLKEVKKG